MAASACPGNLDHLKGLKSPSHTVNVKMAVGAAWVCSHCVLFSFSDILLLLLVILQDEDLNESDSVWRAYAKAIEEVHGFNNKADTKEAESKDKSLESFKRHLKDVGLDYSDVKSVPMPKSALYADVSQQFKEKEANNKTTKQEIESKEQLCVFCCLVKGKNKKNISPTGLEPVTSDLEGPRSIQLSHDDRRIKFMGQFLQNIIKTSCM